jgi:hypothetical protein
MPFSKEILSFSVLDNRLYLSNREVGGEPYLSIFSWDNNELTLRGETEMAGGFAGKKMFLDGTTLIVASYINTNSQSGIALYSVADDSAPTYLSVIPSIGGVAIPANGYLYVRNGDSGGGYLDIWDIRNPTTPQLVQTYSDFDYYPLAVYGTQMIWSGSGLHLYDISTPATLQLIDTSPYFYNLVQFKWTEGRSLYGYNHSQEGIRTVEKVTFADPFEITSQGTYSIPKYENGVAVDDRYVYLFDVDSEGIEIVDMQEPNRPRFVTTVLKGEFTEAPLPHYLRTDQRLFLRRAADIAVLDISNPVAPVLIGVVPFEGNWQLETVANGHIFARLPVSNLMYILRLSDYVGKVIVTDGPDACSAFDTEGNYLVALCGEILLYDITDPMHPVLVGLLESPLEFYEAELAFPYLYTTTTTQLAIYDVSDLTDPRYLTSVAKPDAMNVQCKTLIPLWGRFYLRGCATNATDIVDLSNPFAPVRSDLAYIKNANAIVQGDTLIVADKGLQTWHVRVPFSEQLVLPLIQTR